MFNQLNDHTYLFQTKKFKTITMTAYLMFPFEYQQITLASLLARVMKAGTKKYPDHQKFNAYLESMYGLTCQTNAYHVGMSQLIEVSTSSINEQYIKEEIDLLKNQLTLMHDMIYDLCTEGNAFSKVNVDLMKKQLNDQITSVLNDKRTYAVDRYNALIDGEGVYGSRNIGYHEQLEVVDERQLYDFYQEVLAKMKLVVFVVGDLDAAQQLLLKDAFVGKNHEALSLVYDFKPPLFTEKVEQIEVNQSHLVYGFKLEANRLNQHAVGLVYNQILGGYMQSKLFKVVREQHSLCYTVYSAYQPSYGTLMIYAGIERSKEEKARSLIEAQLKAMIDLDISQEELEGAKAQLISSIVKNQDSANALISQSFNWMMVGQNTTVETLTKDIEAVDLSQIQKLALTVKPMLYYFLAGREEGHE